MVVVLPCHIARLRMTPSAESGTVHVEGPRPASAARDSTDYRKPVAVMARTARWHESAIDTPAPWVDGTTPHGPRHASGCIKACSKSTLSRPPQRSQHANAG